MVVIAEEFSRLTAFAGRARSLSTQLQKLHKELESFALSVGMPTTPEALGDTAELRLLDMSRSKELESMLWSLWRDLVSRESEMVEDQLFVADLLSVALHRLETRLT